VTVDAAQPTAAAVAIAGGRIVVVGSEADVMRLEGPATEVTDLAGRTLVPGFIDGHSHFFSAVDVQVQALCASPPAGPCRTVADLIAQLVKLRERRGIAPGGFVIGFGYDPDLLAEKRGPARQEFDAAFPDNPVIVVHVSGHGAMLNSKALARFQITARADAAGRRDRPRAGGERAQRAALRDGISSRLLSYGPHLNLARLCPAFPYCAI
jgi:hypothetical protein